MNTYLHAFLCYNLAVFTAGLVIGIIEMIKENQ